MGGTSSKSRQIAVDLNAVIVASMNKAKVVIIDGPVEYEKIKLKLMRLLKMEVRRY